MDHLCISYLSTYGLVLGINVKLGSSSFQWYLDSKSYIHIDMHHF